MDKQKLLDLITLNEAAYTLCEKGIYPAPIGRCWPIYITNPPPILKHDPLKCWGFVVVDSDRSFTIILRGTQDLPEWILDAIAIPWTPFSGGHTHKEFTEGWEALRAPIVNALSCLGRDWDNSRDSITGHSLGAAFATLCRAEFGGSATVFACPRVGDKDFANNLSDMTCVFNTADIVPHLPPEINGFVDHGIQLEVNGPGSIMDLKLAHSLESYRKGIEALKV